MNKTKETKRIKIAVVSILAISILFGCIGVMLSNGDVAFAFQSAVGSSDMTIASNSTNISGDLLSSDTSKLFDKEVFWTLVQQVTGNDKIVSNDTLASYASTGLSLARTSADFRTDNGSDVVVYIDGIPFTATYLTKDGSGNVVLTLWQADAVPITYYDSNASTLMKDQVNVEYATAGLTSLGKYPFNSYGTSFMSTNVLNNGGQYAAGINALATAATQNANNTYAKFTMSSVSGSIANYILTPSAMSYQSNATSEGAKAQAGFSYDLNNDSLGIPTAGNFYTNPSTKVENKYYGNSTVTQGTTSGEAGYLAWGNDKIWLPSMAETGYSGDGGVNSGLWKTSTNQRSTSTSVSVSGTENSESYSWLRSASYINYHTMCVLNADGSHWVNDNVAYSNAARPAFHLNLTSSGSKAGDLGAEPPQDVESYYNGDVQTIANVADKDKKWLDLTKVYLDYPSGTTDDGKIIMKDVGAYTVTAKIIESLKNDGFTFVGGETELTFNFTIKKKQIECVIEPAQGGGDYVVKPKDGDANKIYDTDTGDRAPTFTITYTNTQTGATLTEYPTAVGTYTVTATMNPNNNYELKGTCQAADPLVINAKSVTEPSIGTNSLPYNGNLQEFTINGLSADVKIDNIKDVNNKVLEWKDGVLELKDGKLKIKDAGTYYVTFSLVDKNSMVWSKGGTDSFSLSVMINPKALGITISCDANNNSWNYGGQPTVTITEDSYTDDIIVLNIYYINNSIGTGTKYDEINSIKSVSGKTTTITMPSNIAKGDYTIYVEKAAASSSNANGNYTLATPKTLVFHVSGASITLQDTDIDWLCNSISIGYPTNYSVVYTGSAYTFSIDDSVFASRGVKIDTTKSGTTGGYSGNISATNASTSQYSVTVHLTNLDDTYEAYTKQYTLSYRIDKAKYNLTGLSWPTIKELEFNGSPQSMELQGVLPAGLTATYTGDRSKTPVGNYTTTVTFSITSDYVNNYIVPVATDKTSYIGDDFEFTVSWKIIQATISVSWKNDNNGDVAQYTWPTLNNMPQANMVDYTYYKGSEQVTTLPKPEDVTEETTYKVVATLKSTYKNNYKLSTGDTAEYTFVIGKDKFVVKLELQWNNDNIQGKQLSYTGSAYTPTIEILQADGGVGSQDITLKYYKDGAVSPITGEPTEVGTYKIEVILSDAKAEDNYIDSNCVEFTFEIIKATIDTSGIVWGYVIGDGEETEYTGALPYARANGKEAAYIVGLINVPEILKDYISYTGGERTQSKKGNYSIQYVISDLGSNYETLVMPSGLSTRLNWSISVKELPTPVFDKSWTEFDGEVHDFAQMFGVTEDGWENYMTITITKDGNAYDGLDGDAYKAIKAGEYTVVFDLVDYDNIDWKDGVYPAASTLVRVKAYEINLEWQGNNTNSTAVLADWVKSYVDYRYKDGEGNILAGGIRDMQTGVPYYKELYAKDGYEDDIKIYGEAKTVLRPGSSASVVKPVFDANKKVTYNGSPHTIEEFLRSGDNMPAGVKYEILDGNLTDAGDYTVRISLADEEIFTWEDGSSESYTVTLNIEKATIAQNRLEWTTEDGLPKLKVKGHSEIEFSYTYYDEDGYELTTADIADGMECAKVVARLDNGNYAMIDATNTVVEEVIYAPNEDDNKDPNSGDNSGENPPPNNNGGGLFGGSIEEIFAKLKEILPWQLLASVTSIILIIVFLSKTAKYDNERKKFNKKASKLESMYAGAFLGVAMSIWTAIACVLMVMAVVSFAMMIIAKNRRNKAEEEYEDHLDEYNRNKADFDEKKRDENMRMMLMGMMGGNGGQGGYMGGYGMGIDEMRGLISDAVAGLLPNMQQALPQQASSNDELVEQLLEKTAKNEDTIQKLMKKIAEQPAEKIIEREVAASNVDDETIKSLVEGQKEIKQQLADMAKNQNAEPQVVEKIVEVPVEVEKIVEKEVKVEVPVEVEKIVEKEVKVEVPVEVEKIVEKVVEKEVKVEVPVEVVAPSKPKKEVAPRLTLDEAYALLSKQQQKYFDGLRQYALSKPNSKEKKATYAITIGQSTVNPLLKLTIKKDMTVALFKMEDEYLKDIKRDATSDGTKVKVKETEVIISDAQACKVAKNMIDLREDQIERYQDLLKEQRAMKNKK